MLIFRGVFSWELTYPLKKSIMSRWFSQLPQVGYVNFPGENNSTKHRIDPTTKSRSKALQQLSCQSLSHLRGSLVVDG